MLSPEVKTAFDRAAHCQRIGAHGGATTAARYGRQHYRIIGKAGYAATVKRIGAHNARALVYGKGWSGRRVDALAIDLAYGELLAA